MRNRINNMFTFKELPEVLEAAWTSPNFKGLAAFEVYAATAQHLHKKTSMHGGGAMAFNTSISEKDILVNPPFDQHGADIERRGAK